MRTYMEKHGLLAEEREICLGLTGIEDLIKEIDS